MLAVSVVCTTYNEEKTILSLLEALSRQSLRPAEIIFCDNFSVDKTAELIQNFRQSHQSLNLRLVQKKGNRSVGRNAAIAASKSNVVAITDAGCVPDRDWLKELVATYNKTKAPVVAGYYRGKAETRFELAVIPYVLVMPDQVKPDDFLPATRSMLLEKNVWAKLGGFDERLSLNEDYPFAKKIRAAGYKIAFASNAVVEWMPRKTVAEFTTMIYRFAKGDIQAGIVRPKVILLFARYLFLGVIVFRLARFGMIREAIALALTLFTVYSLWAIEKNSKYAARSWYWLPVLQYAADGAVLAGSLAGIKLKLTHRSQ